MTMPPLMPPLMLPPMPDVAAAKTAADDDAAATNAAAADDCDGSMRCVRVRRCVCDVRVTGRWYVAPGTPGVRLRTGLGRSQVAMPPTADRQSQ